MSPEYPFKERALDWLANVVVWLAWAVGAVLLVLFLIGVGDLLYEMWNEKPYMRGLVLVFVSAPVLGALVVALLWAVERRQERRR